MSTSLKILICGGDEVASAAALRMHNCGFEVLLASSLEENLLRHHLCLGNTLTQGQKILENATATVLSAEMPGNPTQKNAPEKFRRAVDLVVRDRRIPVIPLTDLSLATGVWQPQVILNFYPPSVSPVSIDTAHLVVGVYPLHQPGTDCHIAVETRLSFHLGRIYTASHRIPEEHNEKIFFRDPFAFCRSPLGGLWLALKCIGETVRYNEPLGRVDDIEIRSPNDGQIWGLAHSGKIIEPNSNVALIFQGNAGEQYRYLGFREHCIAGAMLEAVLRFG